MTARETLLYAAYRMDCDGQPCGGGEACNKKPACPDVAAALRALATRFDELAADVASRLRALNGSVDMGYLRLNHGEGNAQLRAIEALSAAIGRLDAPLSPPDNPRTAPTPPACAKCGAENDPTCTEQADGSWLCHCCLHGCDECGTTAAVSREGQEGAPDWSCNGEDPDKCRCTAAGWLGACQCGCHVTAREASLEEHRRRMMSPCGTCGAPAGYNCSNADPLANHCPGRGEPTGADRARVLVSYLTREPGQPVPSSTFDSGTAAPPGAKNSAPESPTRIPGEAPTCATWCGCLSADQPRQSSSYMTALPSDNRLHSFCSCDCMLAGKPLNPRTSVTGSGTP
jgi:hypothetical protein